MAGSNQITCGSTPTLLASASATAIPGQLGWAYITVPTGGGNLLLGGGTAMTTGNAVTITAGGNLPLPLFAGDQVYGVASTGTVTVAIFQTGA